ncbi:MAG: preprotein translocase subunit SecE [Syntrophomonadaceae bacterium]
MTKNNNPAKKDDNVKSKWDQAKGFLLGVWYELKKVHWPNRQQLLAYTGVVLFSVAVVAIILWIFDMGLSFALEKLFEAFA